MGIAYSASRFMVGSFNSTQNSSNKILRSKNSFSCQIASHQFSAEGRSSLQKMNKVKKPVYTEGNLFFLWHLLTSATAVDTSTSNCTSDFPRLSVWPSQNLCTLITEHPRPTPMSVRCCEMSAWVACLLNISLIISAYASREAMLVIQITPSENSKRLTPPGHSLVLPSQQHHQVAHP